MNKLNFGTAGAPRNPANLSTVDGIKRIAELGLECMEVEFVEGVRMGKETAKQVSVVAANRNIRLSVHAPYFINLNAREAENPGQSIAVNPIGAGGGDVRGEGCCFPCRLLHGMFAEQTHVA